MDWFKTWFRFYMTLDGRFLFVAVAGTRPLYTTTPPIPDDNGDTSSLWNYDDSRTETGFTAVCDNFDIFAKAAENFPWLAAWMFNPTPVTFIKFARAIATRSMYDDDNYNSDDDSYDLGIITPGVSESDRPYDAGEIAGGESRGTLKNLEKVKCK